MAASVEKIQAFEKWQDDMRKLQNVIIPTYYNVKQQQKFVLIFGDEREEFSNRMIKQQLLADADSKKALKVLENNPPKYPFGS